MDSSLASRIGAINLRSDRLQSGAAFELSDFSPVTVSLDVDGVVVDMTKASKLIVVRSELLESELFELLDAAQRGLDLLCMREKVEVRITGGESENVRWWTQRTHLALQIVSFGSSKVRVGVGKIEITDAAGNVVEANRPAVEWHPHYRFFRYARTTTDLADAYRNAFLALESILSKRSLPISGEGERAWFRRALGELGTSGFDFSNFVPADSSDQVGHLVAELYVNARHPLFHAKFGRAVTLPSPATKESESLLDALQTLMNLYLEVVRLDTGVGRPTGWMYPYVVEKGIALFDKSSLWFTADDSDIDNNSAVSPKGLETFRLGDVCVQKSEDRFLMHLQAKAKLEHALIRRLAVVGRESVPMQGIRLEEELVLNELTDVIVDCGNRFVNEMDVRRRYLT